MKIIHFDIGSNMAFAHNGCDGVLVTEHRVFKGPRQHRAADTLKWLMRRFKEMKAAGIEFDAVTYERPFARGKDATRSLWGIAGVLEAAATVNGWAIVDAENTQIKKFATGISNPGKEGLLEAAIRFGYEGDNEHEADAVCGLMFALEEVCPAPKPIRTKSNAQQAVGRRAGSHSPRH